MTELREHALRFNAEEAGAFFNRTMGLSLSAESVAALLSRTEGWITGLQLAGWPSASRQQARSPERDRCIRGRLRGDDRYIVDYLMAEVLEREPAPVRDFLRQTSILERLSAPLCDGVTGRDDSRRSWNISKPRTSSWRRSTTAASGIATTCCSPRCCG